MSTGRLDRGTRGIFTEIRTGSYAGKAASVQAQTVTIFPVLQNWRYEFAIPSTAIAEEATWSETEAEVGVREERAGDQVLVSSS
jgi:hypothetical protein